MMDDLEMAEFARTGAQQAFEAVVSRHIDWVHSAALRQVGDHHLAEDITQAVFLLLARKAAGMPKGTRLGGWLFQAVRYASRNALKMQRRRRYHERHSAGQEAGREAGDWWIRVAPILDEVVARLSREDRDLILARFYQGQTLEAMAQGSGVSADGVRKRVKRVVGELREMLQARAGEMPEELDGLLGGKMASVAPVGLVAVVVASAGGGGASATVTTLAVKVSKAFWLGKVKVMALVTAGVVVAGGVGVEMARDRGGKAAATQPASIAAPMAKAENAAAWPKVVSKAGREDAVYVAYEVLVDPLTMEELRKVCAPVEGGGKGSELMAGDSEAIRGALKANDGGGVVPLARPIVRRDSLRGRLEEASGLKTFAAGDLPGGQGAYVVNSAAEWSARMSGGKVQVIMDQNVGGMTYQGKDPGVKVIGGTSERLSAMVPVNATLVSATPLMATDSEPWDRLLVVQSYGADEADTAGMAAMGNPSVSEWIGVDTRKWLLDSRRSILWAQRLPDVDDRKWVRTLGDGSELRVVAMADDRVSPALTWSAGGGRAPRSARDWRSPNRGLQAIVAGEGAEKRAFMLGEGQASLRVGVGEGEYSQVGTLDAKDGASITVAGRRYWVTSRDGMVFETHFDNDPAIDVMFRPQRPNGKPTWFVVTPEIWPADAETAKQGGGRVLVDHHSDEWKISVLTRKRVWHTFEGFATRPVAGAPSDAEVMASFAKPLDEAAGTVSNAARDLFAEAKARVIAAEMELEGRRMKYVGDAKGRLRVESEKGKLVCDGERCVYDRGGTTFVSRYGLPNEAMFPVSEAGAVQAVSEVVEGLTGVKLVGEERIGGVAAQVFEGRSAERAAEDPVAGQMVRVWRDGQGRLVQVKLGRMGSVSLRYDAAEDAKLLGITEAEVAKAQNTDAAVPALDELTSRPAVFERKDVDRTVKVHEVVAGENGDVLVGYSVQLTPEAAKVLRFVPGGECWGRGFIEPSREMTRQYNVANVAFIHERDRSLWWAVLTPAAAGAEKPWALKLCMDPSGMPNAAQRLRAAGLGGFGRILIPLPAMDGAKKVTTEAWLRAVHAQVGKYTKMATFQSYMNVQPITGTAEEFVKSAKAAIEAARRGASEGVTAE